MTPQIEFLELLTDTAEKNCNLENSISLTELSAANSLYAELGEGFSESVYFNKSTVKVLPVLFLCKNTDQIRCLNQLGVICDYFQRLKKYPKGTTFTWVDTTIAKEPSKVGRNEDGSFIYSCIINCKIYY